MKIVDKREIKNKNLKIGDVLDSGFENLYMVIIGLNERYELLDLKTGYIQHGFSSSTLKEMGEKIFEWDVLNVEINIL